LPGPIGYIEDNYVSNAPGKFLFQLQLLHFSRLAFFLLLPLMRRNLTISPDFDRLMGSA